MTRGFKAIIANISPPNTVDSHAKLSVCFSFPKNKDSSLWIRYLISLGNGEYTINLNDASKIVKTVHNTMQPCNPTLCDEQDGKSRILKWPLISLFVLVLILHRLN